MPQLLAIPHIMHVSVSGGKLRGRKLVFAATGARLADSSFVVSPALLL
jgi:hypothetical protein